MFYKCPKTWRFYFLYSTFHDFFDPAILYIFLKLYYSDSVAIRKFFSVMTCKNSDRFLRLKLEKRPQQNNADLA